MDDVEILCEIAVMYCVARGLEELAEPTGSAMQDVASLKFNALGCGISFLRERLEKIWEAAGE